MSNSVSANEDCRLPEDSKEPRRAPLAFRVGVVGHRPNRLKRAELTQLAGVLRRMLECVKEEVFAMKAREPVLFDNCPPVLTALSPLAEGTDRLFAEQALEVGYELCCVLPFAQAEFELDFADRPGDPDAEPNSLDRFQGLLAQATTRFELDGNRSNSPLAYGQGGRVVLNQSDLLVVVWDGELQGKRGGTEETFEEARRRGIPVVWVDAHAPHTWQMVDEETPLNFGEGHDRSVPQGPVDPTDVSVIRQTVRESLELPAPPSPKTTSGHGGHVAPPSADLRDELTTFYEQRQPSWNLALVWKAFRDIGADSRFWPVSPFKALKWLGNTLKSLVMGLKVEPYEQAVASEWPRDKDSAISTLVDCLRPYYAWPDKQAVIYSDRYRSTFILAFLLAALAVGMALLPVGMDLGEHDPRETICIVLELTAILVVLSLIQLGRWRKWHKRWIDYRLAAELIRHLRLVAPLGGERPFLQVPVPSHLMTYGSPGASWMAWYVRAIERSLGLPTTVVDRLHLQNCLTHLAQLTQGQIDFHETTARRCHTVEQRLEVTEVTLLILTLTAGGLHLVPFLLPGLGFLGEWSHWLTFCCGFFPALGAALAGINNQGEFRRLKNRSEASVAILTRMLEQTTNLQAQIAGAPSDSPRQFSIPVTTITCETAQFLIREVLDWRVVFLDRPLHPPA